MFVFVIGVFYSIENYKLMIVTPEIISEQIISALDLMLVVNNEGKIVKVNERTEKLLGYSKEELLNKNIYSLVRENRVVDSLLKQLEEIDTQDYNHELTFITKAGKDISANVSLSILKDKFNDILGFVFIGQDTRLIKKLQKEIARRRKVERELRRSEKKYRIFFDMSPDCIYLIDINKRSIIEANPAFFNKFRISPEDLKHLSLQDAFSGCNLGQLKEIYNKLIKGEIVRGIEICSKGTDKEAFCLEINSTPIVEKGKVVKILNLGRDITERKRNEELKQKVEEKNKLINKIREYDRLKNDFFAHISHELRTPLNIILGTLQLCDIFLYNNVNIENKDKLLMYINIMKQNGYRLIKLVNNLIDITKIDSGVFNIDLRNCDIVKLVEDLTLSVSQHVKDRDFIFDTDIEEKVIACDPDRLERALLNLLSNAVKFTTPGDKIMINISHTDEEGYIYISVEDTGVGIPEEKQNIIFQKFRQVDDLLTRKSEGSGVGLSIAKSLVEMHEGTIMFESEYEKGSKFIIKVPDRVIADLDIINLDTDSMLVNRNERINIEFSDVYYYNDTFTELH
jgi:PAS domain S-box-containing protein